MLVAMAGAPHANFVDGSRCAALQGATFRAAGEGDWPQSGAADVAAARAAARAAGPSWARDARARGEHVQAFVRALAADRGLVDVLARHFELEPAEAARHVLGFEAASAALGPAARASERARPCWYAPDWRQLLAGTVPVLARELLAARTPIVVSDGRLPEVADAFARAALACGLPRGVLQVLHGPTRELLAFALDDPAGDAALVASGSLERMSELRRLCERHGVDPRLSALRAGAAEIVAGEDLAHAAEELVERAFGRGTTLGGQLSGALARVHCPARQFARFTELLLEALARDPATRRPVPQIDASALARAQACCELGLDEGATLIAGGEVDGERRTFAPAVLTNVESYMESARRQEPVPVLCLLRA